MGSAIDLHLHLPMIEEQVRLPDLEAADMRLVVVPLYATPVLSQLRGGYARALLRQIAQVERWAAKDPRVAVVRTPDEAEAVLASKEWRLGLILAVEGAGGADTPERLDRLWDRGVRMLTIAHFTDTRWGGAASVRYWPFASCVPGGKPDARRNARGLTAEGEKLAGYAVEKGLILDLTHSSDKTVTDLARRHPELPLMFSHQAARELTPCERTISPELLREVKRSGGMVGLALAANYAGADRASLMRHAAVLARETGPQAVAIGSDFNGVIGLIDGVPGPSAYGLVLKELAAAGIPATAGAESFVRFWRRTNDVRNRTRRP
jgi:microsomal dipeptidase-like Zn-dependent dipeptidase